ncbi:Uncharacterised protein [Serratia entomophila]|uniref:tail fiber/spike domain-containing protein n=1 Tax=Serratia entomophila TaxID=42906 RepID=UPI0021771ACB|nr:hypothetical protein [Serratia entomophila]CAI0960255.1 Uncharacterised protein [Serratia entomophila]CAI1662223.1 Uncharacterised protein [Serratia entomophila]CAI1699939.1 Uncharacterised protein [Serratia entomophila]CAI1744864.1 Uncharacterised protein [Serratia entomophila]CAI2035651.1 Uncharacterised protein [Serratia entomophila]
MASDPAYETAITRAGYIPVNSFENGFTITLSAQALYLNKSNEYFIWKGALPKVVPVGATPETSGGFGPTAWAEVSYLAVSSEYGAKVVGSGQTTVNNILTVDVRQFGAKTISEDPDFDSAPAFRAAIGYVHANGGGVVNLGEGEYRLLSAGETKFTTPHDDATAAPGMTGDTKIDEDPVKENLSVILDISSNVQLRAKGNYNTTISGPWSRHTSPIDKNQAVGIVFRTPNNSRMTEYIDNVGLHNIHIANFFIGVIADGILFRESSFSNVRFNGCAMPFLALGADNITFHGTTSVENCYSGIVIGGWWTQRNNTTAGGVWVPPYVAGTDVYSLGWADFVTFDKIIASYSGQPFGDKHLEVDNFFNTYFFKESYSKKYSAGGRLTNGTNGSSASSDLTANKFRGIAHRALVNFSRYGRGNCNFLIKSAKTWGCSRVPFMGPVMQGGDYYGEIRDVYSENTGFLDPSQPWSDANNFYKSGRDPYNKDRADLPWGVSEGVFGVGRVTYQGTKNRNPSEIALISNGRTWLQLVPKNNADISISNGGIQTANAIRKISSYDSTGTYVEIESLAIGRFESQPTTWDRSDLDITHLFRRRVFENLSDVVLRHTQNGITTKVANFVTSIVYEGGRVKVYMRVKIPSNAATLSGDMNVAYIPVPNDTANFGTDFIELTVLQADIVGIRTNTVYQIGSNNIVGETRQPKQFLAVAGATSLMRLYEDYQRSRPLAISDFKPESYLEFSLEYNGFWNIWNSGG